MSKAMRYTMLSGVMKKKLKILPIGEVNASLNMNRVMRGAYYIK
jgi:hypothetical protein